VQADVPNFWRVKKDFSATCKTIGLLDFLTIQRWICSICPPLGAPWSRSPTGNDSWATIEVDGWTTIFSPSLFRPKSNAAPHRHDHHVFPNSGSSEKSWNMLTVLRAAVNGDAILTTKSRKHLDASLQTTKIPMALYFGH